MNPIKIQLSARQLNTIAFSFNYLKSIHPVSPSDKTARSILLELSLKFQKKNLEIVQKQTLFSNKIKTNFTLKYHEAFYLEYFLNLINNLATNDYDRNVINYVKSNLNQKLV